MKDKVEEWREKLIESAVEQDDDAMESYLNGEEPSLDIIKKCIRKGTRELKFFPTIVDLHLKIKVYNLY